MKRHSLRGILLGLSLALLLGGGVALAQATVTAEPACIECWPGPPAPVEDYTVIATFAGWNHSYDLYASFSVNGVFQEGCGPCMWAGDPYALPLHLPCTGFGPVAGPQGFGMEPSAALASIEDYYGVWTWRMWQPDTGMSAQATNLFAKDCEALEEEFVPEPGTILLLGSGLAGLAGYATLRWRARE